MTKGRVFLIHWNKDEAEAYAETIRDWGWQLDYEHEDGAHGGATIKLDPPSAVVIYLTRLPSHGRATAEYLAESESTRNIPLIFVGGEGEALDKTKAKLPKATFISEEKLEKTLAKYAQ